MEQELEIVTETEKDSALDGTDSIKNISLWFCIC